MDLSARHGLFHIRLLRIGQADVPVFRENQAVRLQHVPSEGISIHKPIHRIHDLLILTKLVQRVPSVALHIGDQLIAPYFL